MYTCLIVDDEPVACEIIQNYCNQLPLLNVIKSCGNALDAKTELQRREVDLLFLDINMPVLNGIAFLKTLTKPPVVIFTTAYQEYALSAFDLSACDYLLKPFSIERFIIAVDKAIERLRKKQTGSEHTGDKEQDYFFIKSGGKIVKIQYADFLFAEAQGNYIRIVSSNAITMANMTFSGFEALLPKNIFIRIHRSFIVNKSKISLIEGNSVFIDKAEIPIGTNYKDRFIRFLGLSG